MTRSSRRRSVLETPGRLRDAIHCCGTARPSAPTASRAIRTQARSTSGARRAKAPERGQASAWSPYGSRGPPQPCPRSSTPQVAAVTGRGKRSRRRRAMFMAGGGSVVPGSDGTARSHAPAPGPAWERRRARWLGGKEGNTHSCRW